MVPLHESSARPCAPFPEERVTARMVSKDLPGSSHSSCGTFSNDLFQTFFRLCGLCVLCSESLPRWRLRSSKPTHTNSLSNKKHRLALQPPGLQPLLGTRNGINCLEEDPRGIHHLVELLLQLSEVGAWKHYRTLSGCLCGVQFCDKFEPRISTRQARK